MERIRRLAAVLEEKGRMIVYYRRHVEVERLCDRLACQSINDEDTGLWMDALRRVVSVGEREKGNGIGDSG